MSKKLASKPNLVYDYDDLLIGSIKNFPPNPLPKDKNDITQWQFLNNADLLKEYGYFGNADKDLYPNFADSYPFDPSRHGIISSVKNAVKKATSTITGVVHSSSSSTPSQSSSSSSSGASSTGGMSTPSGPVLVTSSGTVVGSASTPSPNKSKSGGGGGGSSTGGMSTPSGPVLVTPSGEVVGSAITPEVAKPKINQPTPPKLTPQQIQAIQQSRDEYYSSTRYREKEVDKLMRGGYTERQARREVGQSYENYVKARKEEEPQYKIDYSNVPEGGMSREVEPSVSEYFGMSQVGLPPSQKEVYGRFVDEEGYIKGTLSFFGEKFGSYLAEKEYKEDRPYQPEAQRRLGKTIIEIAPYFTPLGPILLFGGGLESLKPERIERRETEYKVSGLGATESKTLSIGLPIAEVGFGFFGVNSQIRNIAKAKITPKTEFIATIERKEEGSVIDFLAKTSQGKEEQFALGKQLVKQVEGTDRFASMGVGMRIERDITTGLNLKDIKLLSTEPTPKLFKTEIPEPKPFISLSKGRSAGKGFVAKDVGYGNLRAELGQGYIVDKSTGMIINKVGEQYVATGGKAVMRINKATGKVSYVIKEPSIKGRIAEIVSEPEETGIKILQPANIKKTPLSKTFSITQVEQEAISGIIGDISKSAKVTSGKPSPRLKTPSIELLSKTEEPIFSPQKDETLDNTGLFSSLSFNQGFGIMGGSLFDTTSRDLDKSTSGLLSGMDFADVGFSSGQRTQELTKTTDDTGLIPFQIPLQEQPQKQRQKQPQALQGQFFFPGEQPPPRVPPPTPPIIPLFPFDKKKEYLKETPYDAYGYIDSTKKTKARYEKLNREPLTLRSALDTMANYVDKNISAKGKVSQTPPKIQKGKKIIPVAKDRSTGYYEDNLYKFRSYSGKQKKPLPTGVLIEKERYRLDSPSEVGKIQTEKRRVNQIRNFFRL